MTTRKFALVLATVVAVLTGCDPAEPESPFGPGPDAEERSCLEQAQDVLDRTSVEEEYLACIASAFDRAYNTRMDLTAVCYAHDSNDAECALALMEEECFPLVQQHASGIAVDENAAWRISWDLLSENMPADVQEWVDMWDRDLFDDVQYRASQCE